MPDLYGSRELKPRDHKIIQLLTEGMKNREIAEILGTTEHVIKNYLRVIYDKLGMWSRIEIALWQLAREREAAIAKCDEPNKVVVR